MKIEATVQLYRAKRFLIRFLRAWWTLTWLTLGGVAVVAAVIADRIRGEPAILALCVAMILLAQPGRTVRILTGVLTAVGALLVVFQGNLGPFDQGVWLPLAALVGIPAVMVLLFLVVWELIRADRLR